MSYLLTFNATNLLNNGYNNTWQLQLAGSSCAFKNSELSVHSIGLFNSQFNIDSAAYSNNTFSIQMPTGSTTSTINITLPNGYYAYSDINRLIQSNLVSAGAYLIDNNNNNIFYIQCEANATYYSCQFDVSAVPTTLPTGWSRPATGLYSSGGSGLPTSSTTPQLVINNAGFGSVIGFTNGSYPSSSSSVSQSFLSNQTPQINPVSSYILRCSIVHNPYTIPFDALTSFTTQGTSIGQLITYQPTEHSYVSIPDGNYTTITLTIVDQLQRFAHFRDSNTLITLMIRQKNN